MAFSIAQLVAQVEAARERVERQIVDPQEAKLRRIFAKAEKGLAEEARRFYSLDTKGANIIRSTRNIERANKIVEQFNAAVQRQVVRPGREWAGPMVEAARAGGEMITRANLRVPWLSQDQVDAVFDHVPRGIPSALRVGRDDVYQVMGTVGDDVQDWFRRTMLDAVAEELPLQGAGSLAERLIRSGRISPTVVVTKSGRTYRRSITTRANAIARAESAKVINNVHETLGTRALGTEAVWINSNPEDSRTTDICIRASRLDAMTLDEWKRSDVGRPPRLYPSFHLCRSVLIAIKREWLDDSLVPQMAKPASKAKARAVVEPKPKAKEDAGDRFRRRPYTPVATDAEFAARMGRMYKSADPDFMKLPMDKKNSILRAAEDVLGAANARVGYIGWPKKRTRAMGMYYPGDNSQGFQKSFVRDPEKAKKAGMAAFDSNRSESIAGSRAVIERFSADIASGSGDVQSAQRMVDGARERIKELQRVEHFSTITMGDDPLYNAVAHESFHAVDRSNQLSMRLTAEVRKLRDAKGPGAINPYPTEYAKQNNAEYFAETGTAIVMGQDVDPLLKKAWRKVIKEAWE